MNEDADDFSGPFGSKPRSKKKLFNLFKSGKQPVADDVFSSKRKTAEEVMNIGKPAQPKKRPGYLDAGPIWLYRYVDGVNKSEGQVQYAVVPIPSQKGQFVFHVYRPAGHEEVCQAFIKPDFKMTLQKDNYVSFFDKKLQYWTFCPSQNGQAVVSKMLKAVTMTRCQNPFSDFELIKQDLNVIPQQSSKALSVGDKAKIEYSMWCLSKTEHPWELGKLMVEKRAVRIRIGQGKEIHGIEKALEGMFKGQQAILIIPGRLVDGQVDYEYPKGAPVFVEMEVVDVRFAQQQAKPSNPEPQPGVIAAQVSKQPKTVPIQQSDFKPALDTSADSNQNPGAPVRKQSISERMKKIAQANARAGGAMVLPMLTAKGSIDVIEREREQKNTQEEETTAIAQEQSSTNGAMPAGADYGHMPRQENAVPAAHFSTHPHLPSQVYQQSNREVSPHPSPQVRPNPSPQLAAEAFRQGTPSHYSAKPGASTSPDPYSQLSQQGSHQNLYNQNLMRSPQMEAADYAYNQRPPQQWEDDRRSDYNHWGYMRGRSERYLAAPGHQNVPGHPAAPVGYPMRGDPRWGNEPAPFQHHAGAANGGYGDPPGGGKLIALESELKKTNDKLDSILNAKIDEKFDLDALVKSIYSLVASEDSLKTSKDGSDEIVRKLKEDVDTLRDKQTRLLERNNELMEKQVNVHKHESVMDELRKSKQRVEEELTLAKNQLLSKDEELGDLKRQLALSGNESATLRADLEKMKVDSAALSEELASLKGSLGDQQGELTGKIDELESAAVRLAESEKQVANLQAQLEEATLESKALSAKLLESENRSTELASNLESANSNAKNSVPSDVVQKLEADLAQLKGANEEKDRELEQMRTQATFRQKEFEALKNQMGETEQQLKAEMKMYKIKLKDSFQENVRNARGEFLTRVFEFIFDQLKSELADAKPEQVTFKAVKKLLKGVGKSVLSDIDGFDS